jgi:hypothetical protein
MEPLSGIGGVVSGTATPVPPATPTTAQEKGHGGRKKEEEVDRDSVQEGASYWCVRVFPGLLQRVATTGTTGPCQISRVCVLR